MLNYRTGRENEKSLVDVFTSDETRDTFSLDGGTPGCVGGIRGESGCGTDVTVVDAAAEA